jgi:hypothetical protein
VAFLHGATTGFFWCAVMLAVAKVLSLLFNRIRHQDLGTGNAAPTAAPAAH